MRWIPRWAVILAAVAGLSVGGRPLRASAATVADNDCNSATGFATLLTDIANASSGDVIRFTCSGTILFSGTIAISKSLTIDATGQSVALNGQKSHQLFVVTSPVNFEIVDLTLASGNPRFAGGAIDDESAGSVLTIIGGRFFDNQAVQGGAIEADHITLTVSGSTFSGNQAVNGGGAIEAYGATATISNSTFYNNSISSLNGYGGAIFTAAVTLALNNSTLAHNSAPYGGGIYNLGGASSVMFHATVLADNLVSSAGPDCFGAITSNDYNLIDNTFGCAISGTTTHDLDNVSATFQSFGSHGGPTQSLPLATSSNGYDYIPLASCGVSVDQRDFARGDGDDGKCDIGAVETGSTICVPPSFTASVKGSPPVASITAADDNVGLDSLTLTASGNATVSIPPFTPGVGSAAATAQRTDPSKPASVALRAVNALGCRATLDPAIAMLTVLPTQPILQTIDEIAPSESRVTVLNGRPGLAILVLWVNGRSFVVSGLRPGEQREVNVASALHTGGNTIRALGLGPLGSSATLLIGE